MYIYAVHIMHMPLQLETNNEFFGAKEKGNSKAKRRKPQNGSICFSEVSSANEMNETVESIVTVLDAIEEVSVVHQKHSPVIDSNSVTTAPPETQGNQYSAFQPKFFGRI